MPATPEPNSNTSQVNDSSSLAIAKRGTFLGPHAGTMRRIWEKAKKKDPKLAEKELVGFKVDYPVLHSDGYSAILALRFWQDYHVYDPKSPFVGSEDALSTEIASEVKAETKDQDDSFWEQQTNASELLQMADTLGTEITGLGVPRLSLVQGLRAIRTGMKVPDPEIWRTVRPRLTLASTDILFEQEDLDSMPKMGLEGIRGRIEKRLRERADELSLSAESKETGPSSSRPAGA